MRRLLCWRAGGPLRRRPVRAFVVVVLACVFVAACGGDDGGSDQSDAAEDQGAGGTVDAGDDEGGGPPTAGPGEAGELTGPGGIEGPPIPGCPDINVQDRLAEEEYELLLAQLDCIFENRDHMPPEALEIAREAEVMALEESGETTDNGEELEPESQTEPEPEVEPEAEADG
jgi:hypothetical protein